MDKECNICKGKGWVCEYHEKPLGEKEMAVKEFCDNLIKNQEPLGEDFEKVLHKNLWELYDNGEDMPPKLREIFP